MIIGEKFNTEKSPQENRTFTILQMSIIARKTNEYLKKIDLQKFKHNYY